LQNARKSLYKHPVFVDRLKELSVIYQGGRSNPDFFGRQR